MTTIVITHAGIQSVGTETATFKPDYSKMSLSEIATYIYADMRKTGFRKKPAFEYCKNQLDAMTYLQTIKDSFMSDSGSMIVGGFLCNVSGWKGDAAKEIKAELKKRNK